MDTDLPKDKLQLSSVKQSRVFNSSLDRLLRPRTTWTTTKQPNLKSKTLAVLLLGSLPLAFALPSRFTESDQIV